MVDEVAVITVCAGNVDLLGLEWCALLATFGSS